MPKRSSKPRSKADPDPNVTAFNTPWQIIMESEDTGKDLLAVALGRRGGLKGEKARARKLNTKERKEIAVKAAKARWATSKR